MQKKINVFGISKTVLADKLYNMLDDELCNMEEVCDIGEFSQYFTKVLEDYTLVPKTGIIE